MNVKTSLVTALWILSGSLVEATTSWIRKFAASDAPNVLNVHIVPHTHDDGECMHHDVYPSGQHNNHSYYGSKLTRTIRVLSLS